MDTKNGHILTFSEKMQICADSFLQPVTGFVPLPPGQTSEVKQSFLNYFSITVERALKRKPFLLLIVGDFNDRCLTWHSSHENCELQLNLYNTIQSFNLVQFIDNPTRLSSITNSLLDLIITDSQALVEDSGIWPPISSSDHCTVYCKIKLRIKRVKTF